MLDGKIWLRFIIPIVGLFVNGCFNNQVNYNSVETIQMNWQLISEKPVEKKELDVYFSRKTVPQIFTKSKIDNAQGISAIIDSIPENRDIVLRDIRMVCLFVSNKRIDTLLIDKNGHAQFVMKKFVLNHRLASVLQIQSSYLNSDYKPKTGSWSPSFIDEM